jgi:hypothetical protein
MSPPVRLRSQLSHQKWPAPSRNGAAPRASAGFLSVKSCGRKDVVDLWPADDRSGKQWWRLVPRVDGWTGNLVGRPFDLQVLPWLSGSWPMP